MDFKDSFSISALGMNVERARVDVSAMNLANANSALAADGSGFRPMRVVAKSVQPGFQFAQLLGLENAAEGMANNFSIEPLNIAPRQVHEPGHPMANAQGFVSYPAVDTTRETLTMMTAMRAYEANVAAMNMSRNMALKALEIGGGS